MVFQKAMAKIVYACARFTCLKKRLPQSYVGNLFHVQSECGTGKMRAKMVVQPCSDQWKSITILNQFTSLFDTKMLIECLVPPLEILTLCC